MRIAARIRALFLPLLIAPLAFVGFSSWFAAQDGITAVARELLTFKLQEVVRFAASQYRLLEQNGLETDEAFVSAAVDAIAQNAAGLTSSDTEAIFAIDDSGALVFSQGPVDSIGASGLFRDMPPEGWSRFSVSGESRVGVVARLDQFGWTVIASEAEQTFFAPVQRITVQSLWAAGITIVAVLIVISIMARLITSPLKEAVHAMERVIREGDLENTIEARLNDETGRLADSFNHMTRSLDAAYRDIKQYALNAAYAERRESKIRTVFQRYVPQQVIDRFFESPESMLVGEERPLTVLYSDIRGFTAFSETHDSRVVVESLNRYFALMVEVIAGNSGVVDKYIGDAIMAFYGAPVPSEHSAHDAVMTAFQMRTALEDFNDWQKTKGRAPFQIGIAVNHGPVTVGNIGSDRKMDYTVIGDMVNVASRVEGLTKVYRQPILITESVRRYVRGVFPVRMVDRVQVKGRERGLAIWTTQPSVTHEEEEAWKLYHAALLNYYGRDFTTAKGQIRRAAEMMPGDYLCELFVERIDACLKDPPGSGWTGLVKMETK
jgi:class 3 adenylate cyclase/HAMP domain-containing protein